MLKWIKMLIMMVSFFLFMIFKNKNSLLSCLLMLEGLMLMILYFMTLGVYSGVNNYNGLMTFMYISVAEGCLGLSLLVIIVRGIGKDMFCIHNVI